MLHKEVIYFILYNLKETYGFLNVFVQVVSNFYETNK